MPNLKYDLIINHGPEKGFETRSLNKKDFLLETSALIKKPKKVFIGLGDFLEVGDYKTLLDSVFFDNEGIKFENILDNNNRKISLEGNVPYSFFKLAVYFPDFLLKEVPTYFVSAIGEKSRLFPGAETFIENIMPYTPSVLTAMPFEIASEFVKRVGLDENNLVSTEYKIKKDKNKKEIFAGDINRFISGDRKSLEIEKFMNENDLQDDDVIYIGGGEAGIKTFSTINSVAFNPSKNIIPESKINVYSSSLEALLVLFNFDGGLDKFLMSAVSENFIPSLVVYSHVTEKSDELIEIELSHRNLQNNIIGQRIEYSGDSYQSVEREIDVAFAGSSINIMDVKNMVTERIGIYKENPGDLVKNIYDIAKKRYKNFCAA